MSNTGMGTRLIFMIMAILHVIILIIGLTTRNLPVLVSVLNSFVGLSIIAYWALQEVRLTRRIWRTREIVFLLLEAFIGGSAVYCILEMNMNVIIFQYIVFSFHFFGLLIVLTVLKNFSLRVG